MKTFFLILALLCAQVGRAQVAFGTYYISYTLGNDTNNGMSTNAPWQTHPLMVNSVVSGYNHTNGDHFIFCEGDTWPSNCFGGGGMFVQGGNSIHRDYFGATNTWFLGSNHSRPTFDGGYESTTLVRLDLPSSRTPTQFVTFDFLHLTHGFIDSPGDGEALFCCVDGPDNWLLTNCLIDDWITDQTSPGTDGEKGGVIELYGGGQTISNTWVVNTEIENAVVNATNGGNGLLLAGVNHVLGCKLHDNTSCGLEISDCQSNFIHDINQIAGYDQNYHWNGIYQAHSLGGDEGAVAFIALTNCNNLYSNCNAPCIFFSMEQSDDYIFNNVFLGQIGTDGAVSLQENYPPGGNTSAYIYNNTGAISNITAVQISPETNQIKNLFITNNFWIGAEASDNYAGQIGEGGTNAIDYAAGNNVLISFATAAAQGYTAANLWVPTSSSATNVGAGANLTSLGLALLNLGRPATGAWDAGAHQFFSSSAPSLQILGPN